MKKQTTTKLIKNNSLLLLMLSASFLCTTFCNTQNTSATASTLTVSIADTISLNIVPSPEGTFTSSDTSSNTISIKTTNSSGYTLGIKASTNNSNALINTSDSNKTIPSITTAVSQETYSSNSTYNDTWGYRPSKYNSSANSNYLQAPTSSSTITTLDATSAANAFTFNNYNVAIGTKVTETTSPGSYTNTFVFTVTANPVPYTITYYPNDGNNGNDTSNLPSPNPNSSSTYAETVNISSTVPVRNGYNFKGWCTVQETDGTACSGTTYNPDGGGTDLNWTLDQTANSNTLTLYATWEESPLSMQSISSSDCVTSAPTTVVDSRDNEEYLIQRLADGNCWMLDNLRLDPTAVDLSDLQGNTNASDTSLGYLKNGGGTTSDQYAITGVVEWADSPTYASSASNSDPLIATSGNNWTKDTTTTSYGNGSGKIGVYYNYCAASAGSYCYGNGTNEGTSSGNATEDLCPAGWRMPTGGSTGDYDILYGYYDTAQTATDTASLQYNLSTPLSGYIYNGSATYQGIDGFIWSSTRNGTSNMHGLYVYSGYVSSTHSGNRSEGSSMRCLLNN